jgi:hypothetical protein
MRIKQIHLIYLIVLVLFSCSPVRFTAKNSTVPPAPCEGEACVNTSGTTVWMAGAWGTCSQACGGGTQSRPVACINTQNQPLPDPLCKEEKPATMQTCNTHSCNPNETPTPTPTSTPNPDIAAWNLGTWGNCSVSCGGGTRTRTVECRKNSGVVSDSLCPPPKPAVSEDCNTQTCPPNTVTKVKTVTVPASQNQVDILLVVDDSSSMSADNTKLANRLNGFVTALGSANIDWQMCVTTTDVSYYEGRPLYWSGLTSRVLNKNSGNLATIFQQTIYDIGSGYSNDEQGVKASILSVLNNPIYPCYRTGAALSVIIISDEDERSVGGNSSLSSQQYKPLGTQNYPATYINTVKAVFGADKRFAVNSIVVKDNSCRNIEDAEGSLSFIGTRYIELADLTGGKNGSICDSDYSTNLNYFKDVITNTVSGFDLECVPYGAANVSLPEGYNYTISGNHISFTPVLPSGTTVTVTYQCLQ